VIRQDGEPATGNERADRLVERDRQRLELAVDLDPDRLEGALGGMASGPPRRSRDRRRHDRRQLSCRLHRPGSDDRPGDAVGEALVAVLADHARQLVLGVAVDDVIRGPRGVGVHAHIERPLVAVRETAFGAVELRRRHAEVEQRTAQLADRVR
jgi:hypothetical protein